MAITDKNKSTFERLQELKQLYDAGILNKEEMEAEKAKILNQDTHGIDKTTQSSASLEQQNKSPKVVYKGADDKETVQGKGHNKKLLIFSISLLTTFIVLLAALSTCNGGEPDYVIEADTTYTDTAFVDSPSATEYYTGTQAVLETALADNPTVADFFALPEISEAVQNEYGREFYDFLMTKIASCKDANIGLDKTEGHYYEETTYSAYFNLKGGDDGSVAFLYNVGDDVAEVTLKLGGSKVNPDGTFALEEGSKWKLDFEKDEFGDPIQGKPHIYVEGETDYLSSDLQIAVLKENENQIVFYYELPWTDYYDNHELNSIKIKNDESGSVYDVKDCRYYLDHCILSEEDSRYLRKLCDSSPSVSFSIRFDITDYELFMDTKHSHTVFDFDNGRAYGLSNALKHYFHKAF